MIPFRKFFEGKKYVRQNVFPMTSLQADRQSKSLWKAGFSVQVTHEGNEYFVWRAD